MNDVSTTKNKTRRNIFVLFQSSTHFGFSGVLFFLFLFSIILVSLFHAKFLVQRRRFLIHIYQANHIRKSSKMIHLFFLRLFDRSKSSSWSTNIIIFFFHRWGIHKIFLNSTNFYQIISFIIPSTDSNSLS